MDRDLTDRVIACGLRVHSALGPGFLESIYEEALAVEFTAEGIAYERQKPISIVYRDTHVGQHRLDFLIEGRVVLENKAIVDIENVHFAIVRSYLKAAGLKTGLLFNFATARLTVKRVGREYAPNLGSEEPGL
jgi:GxxExxY protein